MWLPGSWLQAPYIWYHQIAHQRWGKSQDCQCGMFPSHAGSEISKAHWCKKSRTDATAFRYETSGGHPDSWIESRVCIFGAIDFNVTVTLGRFRNAPIFAHPVHRAGTTFLAIVSQLLQAMPYPNLPGRAAQTMSTLHLKLDATSTLAIRHACPNGLMSGTSGPLDSPHEIFPKTELRASLEAVPLRCNWHASLDSDRLSHQLQWQLQSQATSTKLITSGAQIK